MTGASYEPYEPSEPGARRSEPTVSLPDADRVGRLTPGPRRVPPALRLATTTLGPIGLFVLFMTALSPMAVWILLPWTIPVAAAVGLAIVGLRCAALYRARVPVLRWGEVATVTAAQESIGSSSYTNVPMRRARGWHTWWESYTGQGRRTELTFTVAGRAGRLVVGGAPYEGGVVLADPRDPSKALCVSQLWFSVEPDDAGQLPHGLPALAWLGVLLTLGSLAALLGLLVAGVVLLA